MNTSGPISIYRQSSASLAALLLLLAFSGCQKDSPPPLPGPRSLEVWLHRVNTISKAQHFQHLYSGFELDVHFDTGANTFIVKHDFSDTTTLTLETWLGAVDHPVRLGYWLDFKNLTTENSQKSYAELLRLRELYKLTERNIVVESTEAEALPIFDKLNFRISYYIPWFDPATLTPTQIAYYRVFIHDKVTSFQIGTISGYSYQHAFMTAWFPEMNKLLWYLDSFDPADKDSIISLTRSDPSVEVLLVAENYPGYSNQK